MNLKALNGAVNVKPDWVARLTRETSGGGKGRSVGTGLELTPAEEWLLNQDMKQYSDGVVPKDINNATRLSLDQPVLVQIINITNASQPSSNQPNSNNALLYLTLTDGVTKFKAVCTEDVQDITVRTPPGTKLLLRKCQIWKGCALLNRKSCTAVGGQVPTLIASWKESLARVREKEIAAAAGIKYTGAKRKSADGPPPFEAFSSAKAIEASSVRIAGGWDDVSTEVDSLIGILKDVSLEDQHFVFKIQDLKSKQKRVNASSGLSKALAARLDCDEQDIDVEKVKTRFALRRLEFKLQMDQDSPHVTDIVEMASHTSSQEDRKPKNDRKKSDNKSNNRKDPAPKKNNSREPRAGKSGDKGKDTGQNKRNNRGKGKSMQQEQSSSSRTKASSDSKKPPPPPPPVSGSGLSVNAPEFVPSSTSSREPSQGKNDTGRGKNETGRGKGNRGGGGGGRGGRGGRGRGRGRGSGAVQTKPPASKSSNRSRGGRGKQDT